MQHAIDTPTFAIVAAKSWSSDMEEYAHKKLVVVIDDRKLSSASLGLLNL